MGYLIIYCGTLHPLNPKWLIHQIQLFFRAYILFSIASFIFSWVSKTCVELLVSPPLSVCLCFPLKLHDWKWLKFFMKTNQIVLGHCCDINALALGNDSTKCLPNEILQTPLNECTSYQICSSLKIYWLIFKLITRNVYFKCSIV